MKDISVNSFQKGMIEDLGKTLPQDGSYLEGRNIRIVANESDSESGILVNIEGNSKAIELSIPQSTLSPCQEAWVEGGQLYFENGMDLVEGQFLAMPGSGLIHYVYQSAENVTAGSMLDYSIRCGEDVTGFEGDAVIIVEYAEDYLEGYGNTGIQSNEIPDESEISNSSNFPTDIIGWAAIRDDLYLFATDNESFNPGGVFPDIPTNPSSYGYIYKVVFNLTSNVTESIELIYSHSQLNFSKLHPIEALGRYETNDVQRLYWTDNYNTVRTINVKYDNLNSLTPEDLDINPIVSFTKPLITGVTDGGDLPSGMYQYAYRLRNEQGAETRFSTLTGLVHVVQAAEGENYWTYSEDPESITEYVGNDPEISCAKTVNIQINNIDTSYDIIEIAAIYRTTKEGASKSYIFSSRKISSSSMLFRHSSSLNIIGLISLAELTSFSANIKRAKTIASKDNRLFIGNIISPTEEIKFNARAYRYKRQDESWTGGDISPTETYCDDTFDPYDYDPEDYTSGELEENLNAINPYNIDIKESHSISTNRYKFKKDGRTLGGEGPFVSYEFIKKELDGDKHVKGQAPQAPPFIEVQPSSADCSTGEIFLDYKNPLLNANFKGYQRDEIYRFGIVLFDKQGNPGYVNWIGDIKFPSWGDFDWKGNSSLFNYTLSQTRQLNQEDVPYFATGSMSGMGMSRDEEGTSSWQEEGSELTPNPTDEMYNDGTGISDLSWSGGLQRNKIDKHSLYALGIKFTINLPTEIKENISGYSIVRVERQAQDKTVLGVGMGSWLMGYGNKDDRDHDRVAFNGQMATFSGEDGWNYHQWGELYHNLMSLDTPDFILNNSYPATTECDYVEFIGALNTGGSENSYENDFVADQVDNFYRKFYSHLVYSWQYYATTYSDPDDGGYTSGSDTLPLDGRFYKPDYSEKLNTSGKLSAAVLGNVSEDFPEGLHNAGVIVHGDTNINNYSVGIETLFIRFSPFIDITGGGTTVQTTGNIEQGWHPRFPYWHNLLPYTEFADEESPNQDFFHYDGGGAISGLELDATLNEGQVNEFSSFKAQEKPLMAWRRQRNNQYGGNTYSDRSRNTYISTGHFKPIILPSGGGKIGRFEKAPDTHQDVWGGDTYVHFYDVTKMKKYQGDNGESPDINISSATNSSGVRQNHNFAFPVESTINIGLREGHHFANKDKLQGNEIDAQQFDDTSVRELYSAESDLLEFYPKGLEVVDTGQYDNRVIYSDEKLTGTFRDNWRKFKIDNYRDIDGVYGPINKLIIHKDNLFSFQDRGVGVFSINPVAVTTTTDSASLVLGTGAVIQNHKYIEENLGSKHQWSVLSTNKSLYWVDILTNSIYKLSTREGVSEISRIKGVKNFFEKLLETSSLNETTYDSLNGEKQFGDCPIIRSGIVAGHDAKNNEVLFSFVDRVKRRRGDNDIYILEPDSQTICFSETTQTFTSYYDYTTPLYINTQDKLLSLNPFSLNTLYLHNNGQYTSWYGATVSTLVRFITNKNPLDTKVFDNYEWHTEVLSETDVNIPDVTWTYLHCENDYQNNTAPLIVTTDDSFAFVNIVRRERTWKTPVLRSTRDLQRFKDKYLETTLVFENDNNYKIRAHYVKVKFRVSKR